MDEKRMLKKIDELESYIDELKEYVPKGFEIYAGSRPTRRVCERLLQISIECVVDICSHLNKELKLGAPYDEDDIFNKLKSKNIISANMSDTLKTMKGFRNILVHRYAEVDDELVFQFLRNNMKDFTNFKNKMLSFLKSKKGR